jgi:predicted N-acyltransferase
LGDPTDKAAASALLRAAIRLAEETECSSLHIQFPLPHELADCESEQLKVRKDCQFHWHNQGYADFDEFLATFSSRKRKKVRQDRRRVSSAGITFRHLSGVELDRSTWQIVYQLISITFLRRGAMPYLNQEFFEMISTALPDNVMVVIAEKNERPIAAAVFFAGADVLYGRYWGSDAHYDALHFETCYYQGIEYCIEHGLQRFEPGTQGEHKIARGFTPVPTYSAHWLQHPEFFDAIGKYLNQEAEHIESYMQAVDDHSPYRE